MVQKQKPAMKYFAPDDMATKRRESFMKWYNNLKDVEYNFERELVEYCESDVDILKRSMEIYIDEGIALMSRFQFTTDVKYNNFSSLKITIPFDYYFKLVTNKQAFNL